MAGSAGRGGRKEAGGGERFQLGRHALDDRGPIARLALAEESHCRVPRAVLTMEHIAPVRNVRKHDPYGSPQGPRQVRH